MITGHVINSSSREIYSTTVEPPTKHYPKEMMLNSRNISLRIISKHQYGNFTILFGI